MSPCYPIEIQDMEKLTYEDNYFDIVFDDILKNNFYSANQLHPYVLYFYEMNQKKVLFYKYYIFSYYIILYHVNQ